MCTVLEGRFVRRERSLIIVDIKIWQPTGEVARQDLIDKYIINLSHRRLVCVLSVRPIRIQDLQDVQRQVFTEMYVTHYVEIQQHVHDPYLVERDYTAFCRNVVYPKQLLLTRPGHSKRIQDVAERSGTSCPSPVPNLHRLSHLNSYIYAYSFS